MSDRTVSALATGNEKRRAVFTPGRRNLGDDMSILTGPHAQINADVQRQWRELMRHHPILARQEDLPTHDEGMAVETLAGKLERDRSHLHRDGVKPLVKMGLIVNDAAKGGYMLTDDGADWSED